MVLVVLALLLLLVLGSLEPLLALVVEVGDHPDLVFQEDRVRLWMVSVVDVLEELLLP